MWREFWTDHKGEPLSQTERALRWLSLIAIVGFVAIAVGSFAFGIGGVLRFILIGSLAAVGALGSGCLLGLLFSLPTTSQQVVVVAPTSTPNAEPANLHQLTDSGYGDNNSLQQISAWLAGAIVALTLAQYDAAAKRFDQLALVVSSAMATPCTTPIAEPAANRVAVLPAATTPPNPTSVGRSPKSDPTIAPPTQICATDANTRVSLAPGELILGAYAILGFLISYLWGRRYLAAELTRGRKDTQNASKTASDLAEQAARQGGVPQDTRPAKSSNRALEDGLQALLSDDMPPVVNPGPDSNDPWKGQFGGNSVNTLAKLSAEVLPKFDEPGLFVISLTVKPSRPSARVILRNKPVRIYLHPTYPEPIRNLKFDANGELMLALVAFGAFTVGAQLDDGSMLEMDLSDLQAAPTDFRLR